MLLSQCEEPSKLRQVNYDRTLGDVGSRDTALPGNMIRVIAIRP